MADLRQPFRACKFMTFMVLCALLSACGGGGGNSGTDPGAGSGSGSTGSAAATVSITPSLGQFGVGSTVRISRIGGAILASGTVGLDGTATLRMGVLPTDAGPFLIEAGKDGDLYFDEFRRAYVPIRLPAEAFALRGVTTEFAASMGLTPFSEFAVGLLEARPGGLRAATAADVRAANTTVVQLYGLHKGIFRAATNEPPSLGVLSVPSVFGSVLGVFEPPAGTPNQVVCETLPSGLQICHNPGAPFSGGLLREQAHAVVLAAFAYMASTESDVVQFIHDLRDDLKDGVFDLRRNGVLLSSLAATVSSRIEAEMISGGTAYRLDANGVLRSVSSGAVSTSASALRSYQRDFLTAYRSLLTQLGLQVLNDYKGTTFTYSGYQDFTLDRNAIESMTLYGMVKALQAIADDHRNRIPRRTIENGLAAALDRYNVAGLDTAMAATAASSLTTTFTNYLNGPAPCDAGFTRNVAGVCVPGGTTSGGSSGNGGASACSNVVGQVIAVSGFSAIPADCGSAYYFTWSTDSRGAGTGTFEGSCQKAMATWGASNARTACYCYVASGTTTGSAVSDGERVCYVGF